MDKAHSELISIQNQLYDHLGDHTLATQEWVAAAKVQQLKKELEDSLRQKAKLNWIKFGDDNTTFFHQSINYRLRHNKIAFIRFQEKDITEPSQIHKAFFDYYSDQFFFKGKDRNKVNIDTIYQGPILSAHHHHQLLDFQFSPSEIKNALWN